jgi:tetratricopeptide (TPR) repeat protein
VKKQQILLATAGLAAVLVLFFFGKTTPPKSNIPQTSAHRQPAQMPDIDFPTLLQQAKQRINSEQSNRITKLENGISGADKNRQLAIYRQLAGFWKDSVRLFEPYAYYTAEAAKLENSEKNLTFAARLFLDQMLISNEPALQHWLANNAKELFEKSLELNPSNDSSKIGLGACYMLGNISDNPMQGILPVREIAEKNPDNMYAQYILALGGKKSGQYDKAIERFSIIIKKQPDNVEIMLHLAECYELKGDKTNAVKWYSEVKKKIPNENAQKELDNRINMLKS